MATAADQAKAIKKATKKVAKKRAPAPKKKVELWQDKSAAPLRSWTVKFTNGKEKVVRARDGAEAIRLASGTAAEMRKTGRPYAARLLAGEAEAK